MNCLNENSHVRQINYSEQQSQNCSRIAVYMIWTVHRAFSWHVRTQNYYSEGDHCESGLPLEGKSRCPDIYMLKEGKRLIQRQNPLPHLKHYDFQLHSI